MKKTRLLLCLSLVLILLCTATLPVFAEGTGKVPAPNRYGIYCGRSVTNRVGSQEPCAHSPSTCTYTYRQCRVFECDTVYFTGGYYRYAEMLSPPAWHDCYGAHSSCGRSTDYGMCNGNGYTAPSDYFPVMRKAISAGYNVQVRDYVYY